ncbi:MAG: class I SAM-dependent rRNA methyltransferase [bacterium]
MRSNTVTISKKGLLWYRTGHLWIYRSDVTNTGHAKSGDVVDATDDRGRFLGKAFYGEKSKIALRLLTRSNEPTDASFFERRIREAIGRREESMEEGGALRLVYSEADGIPGLIADRYADWIVLQALIPGVDSKIAPISKIFQDLLAPRGIVWRNDASARALEGLMLGKRVIYGDQPGLIRIREGRLSYLADIWNGHKTGVYLDQRENRSAVAHYTRGRVLDCFAYQGHFSIHCAKKADTVTSVESSREALSILEKNCALNGLTNVTPTPGNVFDLLRLYQKEKSRFDTIVLDPPPLARKKAHAEDAIRGYKEINLRAMHLLNAGGILASFCCSHSISSDVFMDILRFAAADARCSFRVLDKLGQAKDHPVLLNVPETAYLKGAILQKM